MSSRFININDKILLEYSNEISRQDYKYDIITNNHTDLKSFYLSYSNANETNSHRDNGCEIIDSEYSNRWMYLDIDRYKANSGLVYDIEKEPIIPLYYNHLKIHIMSGYSFDDVTGFIMNIYIENIKKQKVNLLNFAFLRDFPNNNISLNPEPLYINSKYYNRYIELDLIAPETLVNDSNYNFIVNELSNYVIDNHTLVYIDYHNILNTDNNVLITNNIINRSLTVVDKYKYFSLKINEVNDYFEYYATFKGGFPTEYINNMMQMHRKWNITHKIEVYEQVGFSHIKTDEFEKIQRDNFDKILKFRPIIENSNTAFAFSIKYTCIFTDTSTNEQIYRTAHLSKLNPKKYGENLLKLNVDNFNHYDIYKTIGKGTNLIVNSVDNGTVSSTVVHHYIDKINLITKSLIEISPFGNVYNFIFDNTIANNLEYFLSFISNDNEKIYIEDIEDKNTDIELFFKISTKQAEQIRTFANKNYYIIGVNTNGEMTTLVKGTFNI